MLGGVFNMNTIKKTQAYQLFGVFAVIGFLLSEIKYEQGYFTTLLIVAGIWLGYEIRSFILKNSSYTHYEEE